MKKTYLQPRTFVAGIGHTFMICASDSIKASICEDEELNITYGGVDEEGGKDPSSRRNRSVWDDDEW